MGRFDMKRIVALVAVFGLIFGAVTAAEAGKKKKKPVKASLFFHGTETVGELDTANNFGASYNKMDATEPDGAAPKSKQFTIWNSTPWNDCAGNFLAPVWQGEVAGRVVGDIKVTLFAGAAPTNVVVQVWPDIMSQQCASNDLSEGEFPQPAEASATLAPGENTIVIEDVNIKARGALTLQILGDGPAAGRVLYDAADFASGIEFKCIPARGKSCI
jgi:hypothetical protein